MLLHHDPVARGYSPRLCLASGELEDELGPSRTGHAPWAHTRSHLEDLHVQVEENHVDRKAQEARVHGRARAQQEALARREVASAQQPAQARAGR